MSELATNLISTEASSNTNEQTEFSPFNIPIIEREFEETDTPSEDTDEPIFESENTEEDYEEVPEFEVEEESEQEQEQPVYNAELAQLSSDTILLVLENLLPSLAFYFAEIDTTELAGIDVAEGTIEKLEQVNANHQNTLEETVKKNLKPIEAPLKAVMKKRNLNVSPESMLMLTVAMVFGKITMDVFKMRKQNEKLIAQIIALNTPKKEEEKTASKTEKVEVKTESEKDANEQSL